MGSCISTCRPKKPPQDQDQDQDQDLYDPEVETLVPIQTQDKLVINIPTQDQAPKTTNTTPISPPSPSSSLSSFSCNTTSTNASCSSSLSSTSSSSLTSKERAFSNEFLRTCIKDHPHIVKERGRPNVQVMAPAKQAMTQHRATPQKRVRSSSPNNLTRQKSFRKDPSPPDLSSYYAPSRAGLRSPSSSRRFNSSVNKVNPNPTKALSLGRNKENLRPPSPGRVVGYKSGLRNREALSLSKNIDGSRFGEVKGIVGDDDHDIPMEDIDNPLISLDCFIFL